jgi:hypothetical protein
MSSDNHAEGTFRRAEQAEPGQGSKPYPWCLACGFQHRQGSHCAGCNGDHSAGYCMTDELAAQLASVAELRVRVTRASDQLFDQVLRLVRPRGGE